MILLSSGVQPRALTLAFAVYFRYKVPEDTCFDPEDGATNRLSLQLLTMNRKELSSRSWLQFDSRNQEFVGVPLEEEVRMYPNLIY